MFITVPMHVRIHEGLDAAPGRDLSSVVGVEDEQDAVALGARMIGFETTPKSGASSKT